jgi:hypothetical protein
VIPQGVDASAEQWIPRVERGTHLILEGDSPLAAALGFKATDQKVRIRSIDDTHRPGLSIVWEKTVDLPVFAVPSNAKIFAKERWDGAPLVAGYHRGAGSVLWLATNPGSTGRERFPYLVHALADLGARPALRSRNLWAFFDSSYRTRADIEAFAIKWREAGISGLQIAAWHYWEPDPQRDAWLANLIEACHRNAIHVYAWVELPHVSEKFWNDHPEWREKTALLQDAHLDWRKLMNLEHPQAAAAVRDGLRGLLSRFDWDGINLAELYFESLHGVSNAARFTPMNDQVRAVFQKRAGVDPLELFNARRSDAATMRTFLDFRADLARQWQERWINEVEEIRKTKPHLDLVLTHVDDRFDTRMRDLIGADAARVLPLLDSYDFTFLIEDPATTWHLGPQRYPQIAARYAPLTRAQNKLAIDINIVERYQDVYPTKQQTGTELFQLVNLSTRAFERVALYFESSILPPDYPLLSASGAIAESVGQSGSRLAITSKKPIGIAWEGPATVNGKPWPIRDGKTIWLPPGAHAIEPAAQDPTVRVVHFNGQLLSAAAASEQLEFSYRSSARAIVVLESAVRHLEIDGEPIPAPSGTQLFLPRGQHLVTIKR